MTRQEQIAFDLIFHGTVQGVGFRYTAFEIARQYPALTGWVRNQWDGTVEMHVQGPPEVIEAYIDTITRNSRLGRLIDRTCQTRGTVQPGLSSFIIEH